MTEFPAPRLFCFGFGYCAAALARRLRRRGWTLAGTCRSDEKAQALIDDGIDAYRFDSDRPLDDAQAALAGTTHLLTSVPPRQNGDPVLLNHGAEIARIAPDLDWAGYLSTTGVYGDHGGGWVDEQTPLNPQTTRGQRRADAEAAWLGLCHEADLPIHIFRLAGIYGPGRNQLEAVLSGSARRIDKPGQVFSRIHVADIATALEASIAAPNPGAIYNLCDDHAAPSHQVIQYAAKLLGRPSPPLIPLEKADLSEMARSFYADNKRVSNRRIKEELGVRLVYPSYREGLTALLAEMKAAGRPI